VPLVDKCSFCGKSEKFGVRLVRGPDVAICEKCVQLATEVLEGMPKPERPAGRLEVSAVLQARGVEARPNE
jgi:ATP-dependent protease Clp ATPase subunit